MKTVNDICSAMRQANFLSHEDLITINACYAAMVKQSTVLSGACVRVIVDMIDKEVLGQIEQDKIDCEEFAAWAEREDMPGFAGTYARLGALNLSRVPA